jgi:hypothetical protein
VDVAVDVLRETPNKPPERQALIMS